MLSKLFRRLFLERLAAAHDAGRLQFFGYGKRWQAEAVMALASWASCRQVIHAARRADAMLEKGDLDGCAVWKRVLRAVEELQGMEPGSGARVH